MFTRQCARGWLAFSDRKIIPQSFRRAHIRKFLQHKRWELYESRIRMSFVKALRKQDGFRWKLYESRMALWKQDGFRWKLYENRIRMSFTESSTKAGWLTFTAFQKVSPAVSQHLPPWQNHILQFLHHFIKATMWATIVEHFICSDMRSLWQRIGWW